MDYPTNSLENTLTGSHGDKNNTKMAYIDSCALLLSAARKDATQRAERRAAAEAKMWDFIASIMKPVEQLKTLSLNKPEKFDAATGSTAEYVEWVVRVRETRDQVKDMLRDAWALSRDMYGLPVGTSTCGKMAVQVDHVISMMEHTYKQIDDALTTA